MDIFSIIGILLHIISILILIFGVSITIYTKDYPIKNWLLTYLICLLSIESLVFFMAGYMKADVFYFFIISFFVQFLFLTHFYLSTVFQVSSFKRNTILCLGLLPFLIYILPDSSRSFLQFYDRVPYSFTIMLYSLMYFYALINGSIPSINSRNILNGAVLFFFTLDLFLAIATKHLITENLMLVSSFWSLRAVCLQLFYSALIYYGWKSSKSS
jgi:hypothetical protein